jgi:hypothetical protein
VLRSSPVVSERCGFGVGTARHRGPSRRTPRRSDLPTFQTIRSPRTPTRFNRAHQPRDSHHKQRASDPHGSVPRPPEYRLAQRLVVRVWRDAHPREEVEQRPDPPCGEQDDEGDTEDHRIDVEVRTKATRDAGEDLAVGAAGEAPLAAGRARRGAGVFPGRCPVVSAGPRRRPQLVATCGSCV